MTRQEGIAQVAAALRARRQASVEQITAQANALGWQLVPPVEPDYAAQAAQLIDDTAATLAVETIVAQING